jgi:membrane-bound lytic murein transglycosylase D
MIIQKSQFTFSLFIVLFIIKSAAQPFSGTRDDSDLLAGSKTVEMFDSLSNSKFFHSSLFREDMSLKKQYLYAENYIPEYNESLVRERIADMNAMSPIEFRYNEDVMAHIDFYLKRRSFIARLLGLTELYFPMFEEALDKYDLPRELKYVTIIESALNPIAKSKAGASGLWQFMLKTGQIYGLESNSYVDDRYDPLKATDAACRHFIDLYKIYGDWALCLAAYNAGAGRVNRAIKLTSNRYDYWLVRKNLPRETQKYVPAFIAAAYVFTYYAEHNIRPLVPVILDTQIDTIAVRAELSFSVISKMLDIPIEQLELLNPGFRKQLVPVSASNLYMLRLPKNKVLSFVEYELDMYYFTYASKYPDLLSEFVTRSGNTIFEGGFRTEETTLPESGDSTYTEELKLLKTIHTTDELIALVRQYGISGKPAISAPSATRSSGTAGTSANSPSGTYVVQRGESLGIIARKQGCTTQQLMQWNNLKSQTIHPGQVLKVSGTTGSEKAGSVSSGENVTQSSDARVTWHTVKSGETLWGIATKYSTSVDRIKADNSISSNNIKVGQKLKIVTGK